MTGAASPLPPSSALAGVSGIVVATYVALGWCLDWPGSWRLRRAIDPAHERRAREVALHASERMRSWRDENARAKAGSIVFLGSSTIERMPLAELFPGKPALNRGVARASAPELLAWLDRMLPSAPPAAFVVYAGSIDRREGNASDAEVVERVRELLLALRSRAPSAAVALIGVLPSRDRAHDVAELDRRLADLARDPALRIDFVPTLRPPISSAEGFLAEGFSSDALHLDEQGYRLLARWILDDGGEAGRLLAP